MPVGSYPRGASPYGALDMAGNVWEWVADWYSASYYSSQTSWTNPIGPATGDNRVLRGGGWYYGAASLRAAYRYSHGTPTSRGSYIGFRCVSLPGR